MQYMGLGAIAGSFAPALWGVNDWDIYAMGVITGVAFQWIGQGAKDD
jgi:hypothetical protein